MVSMFSPTHISDNGMVQIWTWDTWTAGQDPNDHHLIVITSPSIMTQHLSTDGVFSKIIELNYDGDINAIMGSTKIDDTTTDLGVFELGDGDFSQSQWGTAYNPNETVYGSRWDDDIVGGDADQTFITLSGADSVDGAGGIDTLIIDGNSSDYSFGLRRGGFSIVDKEGVVKEVKSIEQVQFNDRTLSAAEIDGQLRVPSDTKIYWDIGSRLGNSYFTDDFVLEFEVDYTSSQALQQAFTTALKEAGFSGGWTANGDVFGKWSDKL